MKKFLSPIFWVLKIIVGSALFSLGFDLFLEPSGFSCGGLSGIALIITHFFSFGTIGTITAVMNVFLFFIGGKKIGRKFFIGSFIGAVTTSVTLDLFTVLPVPELEPMICVLYGGILCGAGLGLVFTCSASTGGSDIIIRLIKQKHPNFRIGQLTTFFDITVAILTGVVFQNVSNTLYSMIAIFLCGQLMDAVVYHFDYSKVALIISKEHQAIAHKIATVLDRGVTYLYGQGFYSKEDTKVILTAVKRGQLAELKELVVSVDPNAFIVVQEAHQVLGEGFARYSKDSL